jgi:hypothetical protein
MPCLLHQAGKDQDLGAGQAAAGCLWAESREWWGHTVRVLAAAVAFPSSHREVRLEIWDLRVRKRSPGQRRGSQNHLCYLFTS